MPAHFVRSMPPFKPQLSKKAIARVVEMRDAENASFVTIAKELRMTRAKARCTYEKYYHERVLELIKPLEEKAESYKEKMAIWDYCFKGYKSSKGRYDMLRKGQNSTE